MNRFVRAPLAAIVVVGAMPLVAHAAIYGWGYSEGQPGSGTQYARSDAGGTVQSITASFDTTTHQLQFDALLSGPSGSGSPPVTSGFWLVLDNGPNPKTHSGELAILYFDASRVFAGFAAAPTITVYGYNGLDASTSWSDGDGNGTTDGGDLIEGAYEGASFINSATAADTAIGGQTYRHLGFDIDASAIIAHAPSFPVAGTSWYGAGFDSSLGIWFHPAQTFDATYESTGGGRRGAITSLSTDLDGFVDGANFPTSTIPAPAGAACFAVALLATCRRRR